jgi:hypothetical protein
MFEVAWDYLMSDNNAAFLASVIRDLEKPPAERLFQLMLAHNLRTTGEFMPEVWQALFEIETDEAIQSGWIAQMADAAKFALDGLHEASEWIPKDQLSAFMRISSRACYPSSSC